MRGYAAIHGLASYDGPAVVSYNTRVERLDKSSDKKKWILTLKRLRKLEETNRLEATWWKEEFDAVVVAVAGGVYVIYYVAHLDTVPISGN